MKICKTNAVLIWKQLEDVLVPRLCLTLAERAVYSHLLRHSRLEDRLRLRFSILWLARGNRPPAGSLRVAGRRPVAKWSRPLADSPTPATCGRCMEWVGGWGGWEGVGGGSCGPRCTARRQRTA